MTDVFFVHQRDFLLLVLNLLVLILTRFVYIEFQNPKHYDDPCHQKLFDKVLRLLDFLMLSHRLQ